MYSTEKCIHYFIKILNDRIEEYNFKFIITPHEDLALFLQEHKDEINATIVCSEYETALLCRYKSKTYEKMKSQIKHLRLIKH